MVARCRTSARSRGRSIVPISSCAFHQPRERMRYTKWIGLMLVCLCLAGRSAVAQTTPAVTLPSVALPPTNILAPNYNGVLLRRAAVHQHRSPAIGRQPASYGLQPLSVVRHIAQRGRSHPHASHVGWSVGVHQVTGVSEPVILRELPSGQVSTKFHLSSLGLVCSLSVLF